MKCSVCFLTFAAIIGVHPASAAVIGYVGNASGNSSDWTLTVSGFGATVNTNVNFESHPLGGLVSNHYQGSHGVTLTVSNGADQVTSGSGPSDGNTIGSVPGEGPHPSSNYLLMESPYNGTESFVVSFATPVYGAGLFTIDRFHGPNYRNDIAIEAYSGADATGTLLGSFAGLDLNFQSDGLYFMGVVSTAGDIRSIRVVRGPDDTGDRMGIDEIHFTVGGSATQIPEPASIVLLGAGLAGIGGFRHLFRA